MSKYIIELSANPRADQHEAVILRRNLDLFEEHTELATLPNTRPFFRARLAEKDRVDITSFTNQPLRFFVQEYDLENDVRESEGFIEYTIKNVRYRIYEPKQTSPLPAI